jgi:hypothetical protein
MPAPATSTQFGDLLDPRFQKIFYENYDGLPDMISDIFGATQHNGRADMRWSNVGAFGDWSEFTGTVGYDSLNQGYDTTATYIEFVSGCQVERKLFDDDQYHIIDKRPEGLAAAANRTRQKHAFRLFNNAASVDTYFYNNTEGVALGSTAHTTTASGVPTTTGFNNLSTSALTAVSLSAARIKGEKFRDDRGNRLSFVDFDELWVPVDLWDQAWEINNSAGKPDTANNNANIHKGKYELKKSLYLSDTNDWSLHSSKNRKQMTAWVDRVSMEFKQAEDIDTMVAKWRGYMRYSMAWIDWRFAVWSSVS